MNEYISREAALDVIREVSERYADESLAEFAYNVVINIPATDVQPVKCGRWLTKFDGDIYEYYECSECGNTGSCETTYCPNCGARMDGEQNDTL